MTAGSDPRPTSTSPPRLESLDAYRGFAMLLMASDGLGIGRVAASFPESRTWQLLADQVEHREWLGCTMWDLIQPSFTFMVGVAMPYSLASRQAKGASFRDLFRHAIFRGLALVFLGVFLRSVGKAQTYFTFEDVLSQIGLGYPFLFLLGWKRPRTQAIAAFAILFAYWAAFALYPLPGAGFDSTTVGVPADWPQRLDGFAAHWGKNTNFAARVDQWFLNLFPRQSPFRYNSGGYLTLSFVPSLVTMIFGMLAGGLLRGATSRARIIGTLVIAGAVGLGTGALLDLAGICPSVKRIWTPSWTLFSTGWCCLFLAGYYYVIDVRGWRRWTFPLLVVGMNSIAMYCLSHLINGFIAGSIRTHLGANVFDLLGAAWAPIVRQATVLFVLWLILLWMYRRRIFLRI